MKFSDEEVIIYLLELIDRRFYLGGMFSNEIGEPEPRRLSWKEICNRGNAKAMKSDFYAVNLSNNPRPRYCRTKKLSQ